jgi:hypothetical protein
MKTIIIIDKWQKTGELYKYYPPNKTPTIPFAGKHPIKNNRRFPFPSGKITLGG